MTSLYHFWYSIMVHLCSFWSNACSQSRVAEVVSSACLSSRSWRYNNLFSFAMMSQDILITQPGNMLHTSGSMQGCQLSYPEFYCLGWALFCHQMPGLKMDSLHLVCPFCPTPHPLYLPHKALQPERKSSWLWWTEAAGVKIQNIYTHQAACAGSNQSRAAD